jgi:peptidyl-prolyl cis-trans isomerase C
MDAILPGGAIAQDAIWREMQHHPAATREAAEREAAEALTVRALLLAEAERRGFAANPDDETSVQAAIEALIEEEVPVVEPDEAACRAFYAAEGARLKAPDLFEASHILIAAPSDDAAARAAAKAEAERLIAALAGAPERFADFAREHSACESARQGGHLGQFAAGCMAPEIDSFLRILEEGQISSAPVPTQHGYHVLRLERRAAGRTLPYESVRPRIAAYLAERDWRRRVHDFIAGLPGTPN